MYFQKDYILRMIEMMGDLMRRVREMMEIMGQVKLLDEACRRHAGIPLETAEALTADSLLAMLQPMPRLMVSEVLYIKATSVPLPTDQAEALLYKSLRLLSSLWGEGPLCEVRADRLLEMKAQVYPLLDGEGLMDCARFLLEGERYDAMEDALFQAVEGLPWGEEREAMAAQGDAMLRKAARAKPEALAYCNLSTGEMLEAVGDLAARAHP